MSQIINYIIDIIKKVLSNPMIVFVYGILSKWYILIFVSVVVVVFFVFKGLDEIGLIDKFTTVLSRSFYEVKAVAQNCTPKLLDFRDLWACLGNPGKYEPIPAEQELMNIFTQDPVNGDNNANAEEVDQQKADPYSE